MEGQQGKQRRLRDLFGGVKSKRPPQNQGLPAATKPTMMNNIVSSSRKLLLPPLHRVGSKKNKRPSLQGKDAQLVTPGAQLKAKQQAILKQKLQREYKHRRLSSDDTIQEGAGEYLGDPESVSNFYRRSNPNMSLGFDFDHDQEEDHFHSETEERYFERKHTLMTGEEEFDPMAYYQMDGEGSSAGDHSESGRTGSHTRADKRRTDGSVTLEHDKLGTFGLIAALKFEPEIKGTEMETNNGQKIENEKLSKMKEVRSADIMKKERKEKKMLLNKVAEEQQHRRVGDFDFEKHTGQRNPRQQIGMISKENSLFVQKQLESKQIQEQTPPLPEPKSRNKPLLMASNVPSLSPRKQPLDNNDILELLTESGDGETTPRISRNINSAVATTLVTAYGSSGTPTGSSHPRLKQQSNENTDKESELNSITRSMSKFLGKVQNGSLRRDGTFPLHHLDDVPQEGYVMVHEQAKKVLDIKKKHFSEIESDTDLLGEANTASLQPVTDNTRFQSFSTEGQANQNDDHVERHCEFQSRTKMEFEHLEARRSSFLQGLEAKYNL